jgi:hypothetical protein
MQAEHLFFLLAIGPSRPKNGIGNIGGFGFGFSFFLSKLLCLATAFSNC